MDSVLWSRLSSAVETSPPADGLVPADPAGHPKGLGIAPVRVLELIDGWSLAQGGCRLGRAWRLSLEKRAGGLARSDALVIARGMRPGCTIRAAHLSRRSRQLGLGPDFFRVGGGGRLVRLSAITDRPVIRAGSLLRAW
jgi:hypothetical protein